MWIATVTELTGRYAQGLVIAGYGGIVLSSVAFGANLPSGVGVSEAALTLVTVGLAAYVIHYAYTKAGQPQAE